MMSLILSPPITFVSVYMIHERFVLETLESFLQGPEIQKIAEGSKARQSMQLLKQVLNDHGTSTSFNGNVLDRFVLDRLVTLQREYSDVTKLPFFPKSEIAKNSVWNTFKYEPLDFRQYDKTQSIATFLASDPRSTKVVYSPEPSCRPGGIVMFESSRRRVPRRAISVGVALYSNRVTKEKVVSQYWSTVEGAENPSRLGHDDLSEERDIIVNIDRSNFHLLSEIRTKKIITLLCFRN